MSNEQTAGPFGQPKPEPTTAEILGQYRRDLLAQGIDPHMARDLVRDAARSLHRDGITVSPAMPNGALSCKYVPHDCGTESHICEGVISALKAHRALLELFAAVTRKEGK